MYKVFVIWFLLAYIYKQVVFKCVSGYAPNSDPHDAFCLEFKKLRNYRGGNPPHFNVRDRITFDIKSGITLYFNLDIMPSV